MEFNFDIAKSIGNCDNNGICILNGLQFNSKYKLGNDNIAKLLDEIGSLSAKAQELKATITSFLKFCGTDQRIYLKCDANKFIGFIKVGKKKLFIYDELGSINELNPLCVLDFYVYEGCQRTGFGKEIFTKMIDCEKIEPRRMGYDRPSGKLLSFLKKHFNLKDYVPQNNNYVVFNDYFYVGGNGNKGSGAYMSNNMQQAQSQYQGIGQGQGQAKTFQQLKKDAYCGNKDDKVEFYIEDNKGNSNSNLNANMNGIDYEDYIKKMTLPYNYQYTSTSSEYGAFHNMSNSKNNYHYYK